MEIIQFVDSTVWRETYRATQNPPHTIVDKFYEPNIHTYVHTYVEYHSKFIALS